MSIGDDRRDCGRGLSRGRHHRRWLRYGGLRFHLDVRQLRQHRYHRVRVRLLHVPQHVATLDVRLAALRAVVILFAGMRSLMGHQMSLADEVLRAHIAAERPLHRLPLGVAALVEQQIALERE